MQKILFATCSAFLVEPSDFGGAASGEASHHGGTAATEAHDKEVATDNTANADIVAALAKLPAEDRAVAEKQKVCPVSGEALGTMGMPIKLDVKGQARFLSAAKVCKGQAVVSSRRVPGKNQ